MLLHGPERWFTQIILGGCPWPGAGSVLKVATAPLLILSQVAIIVLAVLLFLAAMLFILMNWYYRTV